MRDDNEPTKAAKAYQLGQDLSQMSVRELDELAASLIEEGRRVAETRAQKRASQAAADLFFRKPD